MVPVRVLEVLQPKDGGSPCILLADNTGRVLPIFVGAGEALAAAAAIRKVDNLGRPLTHQLMHTLLMKLNAKVESVTIEKLSLGTFYAKMKIHTGPSALELDCRASDAVALALNTACPIYVSEEVMQHAEQYPQPTEPSSRTIADSTEILSTAYQSTGKGLKPPKTEEEMKEYIETRRAFVSAINGLVTRQ